MIDVISSVNAKAVARLINIKCSGRMDYLNLKSNWL